MVDLGTGLAGLALAPILKDLLGKVLGPTADYAGGRIRDVVQAADENTRRILGIALRHLGSRADGPEAVPPRVIKGLLTEAPFCDDALSAEYFGGVLASSRTGNPRDDRGAALMALIGRLTTYQIRAHFLLYSAIKAAAGLEERSEVEGEDLLVFVPLESFEEGMDFAPSEDRQAILGHSVFGLVREGLVANGPLLGEEEALTEVYSGVSGPGIVVGPSLLGAELFLWAHGRGDVAPQNLLRSDVTLSNSTGIAAPADAVNVERRHRKLSDEMASRDRAVQNEVRMRQTAERAAQEAQAKLLSDLTWRLKSLRY
ncbi:MAG: hypothetical protein L6R30_26255 [Thermoanaerobaculia bacterium]|nr:hypothetical protein [Thermoanaerobaculia bacterium]